MSLTAQRLPDTLHLGCGEDYRENEHNVDFVDAVEPDEVVDLTETPWPWPDSHFTYIRAYHILEHLADIEAALRECSRVLVPDGELEVRVPMGLNAIADPDHEHVWTWLTPEFYCGERHWDTDVGLSVVDKDVSLHSHDNGGVRTARRMMWAYQLRRYGPGQWCFNLPTMSGEFTVVFEA